GSRTARTRTGGQTPGRSARHRRRGVDEPRPRQDTRPACVLPGTVWGAASGQNCQVQLGAVLTLNSDRRTPGCRGARCRGYPRSSNDTTDTASAPDHADTRARANAAAPHGPQVPRHRDRLRPRTAAGAGATSGDNDRNGRTEISGSTQMSNPGSIRVSAEALLNHPTLDRLRELGLD